METFKNFFINNKWDKSLVGLISIIVIFISLWRLPYSPATWFDEGINIGIAKSLVEHGVYSLQVGPEQFVSERPFLITTNYPVLFPVAVFLKLFGINLTAARISAVIFLWLFCVFAYYFVLRLSSDRVLALCSVTLIITFAPFYGNGKAVLGEVPGLTYFLVALLCLNKIFSIKRFFLAGILFGLAIATKPFFLIILPALFVGELYNYKKYGTLFWKRIATLILGLSIPFAVWFVTIISPFSLSKMGDTLHYYSNSYAASNFGNLVISNLLRFVTESTPLHFLLLFLVTMIGFVVRIKKKQLTEMEVVMGIFVVLNLLWYLKTPGWYRYFFTAHLSLFLFFPFAITSVFRKKIAFVCIAVLIIVQGIHLVSQQNNPLYNSDETIVFSRQIIAKVKDNTPILIINSPSLAFLLHNRQLYQYLQINPVLHFGNNSLKYNARNNFSYIAINGSVNTVAIDNFESTITKSYRKVAEVGHFSLYQINYGSN